MYKFYFSLIFVLLISINPGFGQQDPMYSQYMFNGLAINPAYAGSSENFSATALYRKQWVNVEGAPTTQTLAMDIPVFHNKVGLGLNILNDKIGIVRNTAINGMYSYRLIFEKGTLAMGLQAGIDNYVADYNNVSTSRQNTPDYAFSNNLNRILFNWGGGIYFSSDKFYAGFSVPRINNNRLSKGSSINADTDSKQYRHYYFTAGYVITINDKFKTKPSLLLKFVEGAPIQFDFNNNIWYKEKFGFGLSYRTNDSFSALLQFQANSKLRFGYSYDMILTKWHRFNSGTHEIMLRYELRSNNSKVLSPRFY